MNQSAQLPKQKKKEEEEEKEEQEKREDEVKEEQGQQRKRKKGEREVHQLRNLHRTKRHIQDGRNSRAQHTTARHVRPTWVTHTRPTTVPVMRGRGSIHGNRQRMSGPSGQCDATCTNSAASGAPHCRHTDQDARKNRRTGGKREEEHNKHTQLEDEHACSATTSHVTPSILIARTFSAIVCSATSGIKARLCVIMHMSHARPRIATSAKEAQPIIAFIRNPQRTIDRCHNAIRMG